MTDFGGEIDRAIKRQRQQDIARQLAETKRRNQETRRDEQKRRQSEAIDALWRPVVSSMVEMAADAADALVSRDIRPRESVHVIRRYRDAGFFIPGKLITSRVPVWIIDRWDRTKEVGAYGVDYRPPSSITVTSGRAMGRNGGLYNFSTSCGDYSRGRDFLTKGAVGQQTPYMHSNARELFQFFGAVPPGIQSEQNEPITPVIFDAWRRNLAECVARVAIS